MMGSVYPFDGQPASDAAQSGVGLVVVYPGNAQRSLCDHECATYHALAQRLAFIKGYAFAGEYDASRDYSAALYFVPSDTFLTLEDAHRLGVRGEQDLFGGVVPFPFIATKTITHPLYGEHARAPDGWSRELSRRMQEVVLPGFSAFSLEDARNAGRHLLEQGAVRLKMASGIGGLGQWVLADADKLDARLQALDADEVARCGLVLERNLPEVSTLSVGQVRVDDLLVTYCGTQQLTVNNAGEEVYGGSRLIVARGDFDALLGLKLERQMLMAIAQARQYHAAVMQSFPEMFASRCNYDVAQGIDEDGRWQSGVLEQSWRIGGASGAEVAAFEAFRGDPSLQAVCASTTEIYGADGVMPADADIYFQGVDESVGPITKYARLEPYANS
ncbi:DUF3182 family protein [Noviherbaspirillum sp.]|uniref:DUF3182 family protein n=1 Tax=Noviherbaspirillum sp. TaxID=1926288 RepID=UPI002B48BC14|nr:DUF3182 family protein [Noviherbaspirillum sp.]HJV81506.1 DUF3182 family protein [Noviherbaspirillum sp.]